MRPSPVFLSPNQLGDPVLSFRGRAVINNSLRGRTSGDEIDYFEVRGMAALLTLD
jgi:hypothetical protein